MKIFYFKFTTKTKKSFHFRPCLPRLELKKQFRRKINQPKRLRPISKMEQKKKLTRFFFFQNAKSPKTLFHFISTVS
jgi:hypothetical protein